MKVICMYLPQYHRVEENDQWWGDGYTEWTAVKRNKPVFRGHYQPRVPRDGYYDLVNDYKNTFKRQSELMKKYDIYGLCFYHYWFSGKKLLEKPIELLLKDKTIDIKYSLCWANETWTRTWDGNERELLIEQKYGEKDEWIKHFNYLNNFFQDERYIKVDGKPVIHIYRSLDIPCFEEMINCWREEAIKKGYPGIYVIVGNTSEKIETRGNCFDAYYNFEPGYSLRHKRQHLKKIIYLFTCFFKLQINNVFKTNLLEHKIDCDELYQCTLKNSKKILKNKKVYHGTFPMWDNTPRRQYKGTVIVNCSPQKFKENLKEIKKISYSDDFVYINAWNEWSEGAYLEPDTVYGEEYLKAVKEAVNQ